MKPSVRTQLFLTISVVLLSWSACSQERRFTTPNSSMEPTVSEGEKFVVDTTAFRDHIPSRGDVIAFHHNGLIMLKRVVAISGDTVAGKDFEILLNGKVLNERYIQHREKSRIPADHFLNTFPRVVVPEHEFFVMGDNRDVSDDSRDPTFGTIALSDIIGKAISIVKSPDAKREDTTIR
jgi:signal peptidase I